MSQLMDIDKGQGADFLGQAAAATNALAAVHTLNRGPDVLDAEITLSALASEANASTPPVEESGRPAIDVHDTEIVEEEPEENGESHGSSDDDDDHSSTDGDSDEDDTCSDERLEESEAYGDNDDSSPVQYSEEKIDYLMERLLLRESELADSHEHLEEETVSRVTQEVTAELAETLSGAELNAAVKEEMAIYTRMWKRKSKKLEEKASILQEKLEDAKISLPEFYRSLDRRAPEESLTEVWKRNTHWAGLAAPVEAIQLAQQAEQHLQRQRPVKNRHGKIIEEGASGFLKRKIESVGADAPDRPVDVDEGWSLMGDYVVGNNRGGGLMGTARWAAVYSAATPEEATKLGLKLPGEDKIEEIGDLDTVSDPVYVAAVAHERSRDVNVNVKKVREVDDIRRTIRARRVGDGEVHVSRRKRIPTTVKRPRQTPLSDLEKLAGNLQPDPGVRDFLPAGGHQVNHVVRAEIRNHGRQDGANEGSDREESTAVAWEAKTSRKRPRWLLDVHGIAHVDTSSEEGNGQYFQLIQGDSESPNRQLQEGKDQEIIHEVRTTVVIDSDGEREVEEHVSGSWTRTPRRRKISSLPSTEMGLVDLNLVPTLTASEGIPEAIQDRPHTVLANKEDVNPQPDFNGILGLVSLKGEKFCCTGCGTLIHKSDVQKHPILPVGVCRGCFQRYHSGPFTRGEDGSEAECRWCGDGGSIVCCEKCDKVFCKKCIRRNFGENELNRILGTDWECYICNSDPLKSLVLTETPGELLVPVNSRKKSRSRRRNIRKIADDDEKTKELLQMEKDRQERQEEWLEDAVRNDAASIAKKAEAGEKDEIELVAGKVVDGCVLNTNKDEELVCVCPSISRQLKPHQVSGVRFMWQNIIDSVDRVKSGERGTGCILAHSMGLGKTLQVIAFLQAVLAKKDWSLKSALVVVPLNVLHNWRNEFRKWRPDEMAPVPVFMYQEPSRDDDRIQELNNWQEQGGVMLMGYSCFRNLVTKKPKEKGEHRELFVGSLQNPGPDILVCDEAHLIKSQVSGITKALRRVRTRRRIALTGSPLQNNLMEYYCMVNFVREDFLGTEQKFRSIFLNPIENGQMVDSTPEDVMTMKEQVVVLHKRLEGFVQRVGSTLLKDELPPKCAYIISVRLSPQQRFLYETYLQSSSMQSLAAITENGRSKKKSLFGAYHTLSKVWNHPEVLWIAEENRVREPSPESEFSGVGNGQGKLKGKGKRKGKRGRGQRRGKKELPDYKDEIPDVKEGVSDVEKELSEGDGRIWWKDAYPREGRGLHNTSGKIVVLLHLLSLFSARGDKALVFSTSLPMLDLIEKYLGKVPRASGGCWTRDIEWYRFDGTTTASARQGYVDSFNNPMNVTVRCMLISTKAGSLGINLPSANRVVMVDGSWNPTHDLQALCRVWRFGQKKPVYAYRLCAHGTMEEKIYNRQVFKEGMAARVLDQVQVNRHFTAIDLLALFKLDKDNDGYDLEEGKFVVESKASSSVGSCMVTGKASSSSSRLVSGNGPVTDDVMRDLLAEHHPKWIIGYRENEPLLKDVEDEKLSEEEVAVAWEKYKKQEALASSQQQQRQQALEARQAWQQQEAGRQEQQAAQQQESVAQQQLSVAEQQGAVQQQQGAVQQQQGSVQQQQGSVQQQQGSVQQQQQHQQHAQGKFPRQTCFQHGSSSASELHQQHQRVRVQQPRRGDRVCAQPGRQSEQGWIRNVGLVHHPTCSPEDHAKFFSRARLAPGDQVMCNTCKQVVGWDVVNR